MLAADQALNRFATVSASAGFCPENICTRKPSNKSTSLASISLFILEKPSGMVFRRLK